MKRRNFITTLILDTGASAAVLTPPLMAQQRVYLTEQQALKLIFPHSESITVEDRELTPSEEQEIALALRYRLAKRRQRIWRAETGGKLDGYAMVMDEIGKEQYITFIVGVTPEFRANRVALMVFRESRGWEVEDARFTNQFRGKRPGDRLVIGTDINGIAGATLSSQAFCRGVKKALVICETVHRRSAG